MLLFRHLWRTLNSAKITANHDYFNAFLKSKSDIESLLTNRGTKISDANILVLGCGYIYPDVILWSTTAKQVTGIDVIESFWKDGFTARYRNLRKDGLSITRSFVTAILNQLTFFRYFDELRNFSNLELDEHDQNLKTYDGCNLPFPNETFDLVCSNAVLEHVNRQYFAKLSYEISRITRPSGISYHLWHNYYSLSGGHLPDEMALAHPWGHLTGDSTVINYRNFSKIYLNKMLPEEIAGFLSHDFRCLAVYSLDKNHNKRETSSEFTYEGEELFNKMETRLSKYRRNTLLTRSFLFVGVKERT
jgi:SAM-dependent methyltransferase